MTINFEYLRLFEIAAKHMNISKAAAELHLSQPTVTKELRMLEQQIGFPLFSRHSRGVTLTAEGAYLHSQIQGAVQTLLRVEREADRIRSLESGSIRLSFNTGVARSALQPIIDEFQKLHPGITIQYSLIPRESIISNLRGKIIELAFAARPANDPIPSSAARGAEDIAEFSLGVFHDLVLAPARLSALAEKPLRLAELSRYPLILPRAEDEITQKFYERCLTGTQKKVLFLEDMAAISRLLQMVDYVAIVPYLCAKSLLQARVLVQLRTVEPTFSQEYLLHYSRSQQPGYAAMKLVEYLNRHELLSQREISCTI